VDYRHKARRSTGDFQNTIRQAAQLTKLDSPVTLASYRAFPSAQGYSKPDPTKPVSGWRSAWRSLTRAVNCPACGKLQNPSTICGDPKCGADVSKVKSSTAGLRFHDLRHHAITELAESQASDRTVMAIAPGTYRSECWPTTRMYFNLWDEVLDTMPTHTRRRDLCRALLGGLFPEAGGSAA
jgi:hypothetical protein